MYHWDLLGWDTDQAERAFAKAVRTRQRRRLLRRVWRGRAPSTELAVFDVHSVGRSGGAHGVGEIALNTIVGTLEPHRAAHFDRDFSPAAPARGRWVSVWVAMHRGTVLPPIKVVPVGDGYAIRDGHHRVSVARARGAQAISAIIG
jgi:hypothetical protein